MQTEHYSIYADIPRPITFAFLSDIHEANCQRIYDVLVSYAPDAVLIGGDFVHSPSRFRRGIALICALAERSPVFCSIGNHDLRLREQLPVLLGNASTILLDNAYANFHGVWIGGLSSGDGNGVRRGRFAPTADPDAAWLEAFCHEDGFHLLLCHHPEYYDRWVRPLPIELTLSGHAHGGQWRVFGRGLFAPGQGIFPRYTSGLYEGRLLVGRGVGNPHLIPRLNNPPELILLRIGANEPAGCVRRV